MKHISRAQAPELLSTPELSSKALSPCIVVFALCMLGMIFCAQEGLSTTLQNLAGRHCPCQSMQTCNTFSVEDSAAV